MVSAQLNAQQSATPQQQTGQPAQKQPVATVTSGQQQAQFQTTPIQFTDFASI